MPEELKRVLQSIDALLDTYAPAELDLDRLVGDTIVERSSQRPALERVVAMATEALEKYPFSPELLCRRALAKIYIVTPDGEYPLVKSAEQDYRLLLDLNPNNLVVAAELLETLFTFSGLKDSEVVQIAADLASRAEQLLLQLRALQIKALGYSGQHDEAEKLYQASSALYPESEVLEVAIEDAREMNPDHHD